MSDANAPTAPSGPGDGATRLNLGIVGALWLAETTGAFETSMIYAAQRVLTEDLGDPVRVGWLITAYLLIGGGTAAVAGRLGDLFGRRRMLIILLTLAVCGSLMSALAPNYAVLLLGRCLQGCTGAILALCIGIVSEALPKAHVSIGIGLMISGASAGAAMGLVVGGVIVDQLSWHYLFLASGLLAAVSALLIWTIVPRSPVSQAVRQVDWTSGLLFVPGIFALLAAVTYGPGWGWADVRTLGLLALALLLVGLWVLLSLRSACPLFDVRLFANRVVWVANGANAILAVTVLQITLVFSLLLQSPAWTMIGLGASATVAGLVKMPSNISSLAGGPLSGWLTSRLGGRVTMLTGGAIATSGWLLALVFNDSIWQIMAVLVVVSFGTTMLYAVAPALIADAVPSDRTSEAAGILTVTRQIFMGVGAQLVTIMLAADTVRSPDGKAHYPTPAAFETTMWVIVAGAVAGTLMAFLLPRDVGRGSGR